MIVSVYDAPRGSGKTNYAKRLADTLNCDCIDGLTSIPNLNKQQEVVIDEYVYYRPNIQEQLVTSSCKVHLVGTVVFEHMHPSLRTCLRTNFPEVFI